MSCLIIFNLTDAHIQCERKGSFKKQWGECLIIRYPGRRPKHILQVDATEPLVAMASPHAPCQVTWGYIRTYAPTSGRTPLLKLLTKLFRDPYDKTSLGPPPTCLVNLKLARFQNAGRVLLKKNTAYLGMMSGQHEKWDMQVPPTLLI